jgi:hypothetical protein
MAGSTDVAYLYVHEEVDWFAVGSGATAKHDKRRVRWMMVARIAATHASFHWHGFSHTSSPPVDGAKVKIETFRYWDIVDAAIASLEGKLGATWPPVHVPDLVYRKLWKRFLNVATHKWEHVGVNAERDGVVLNTRSSTAIQMDGLAALTRALAKQVVKKLPNVKKSEDEIERTLRDGLIRDWGTKIYTFQLDTVAGGKVLRMRAYMGQSYTGHGRRPNTTLAHFYCYSKYGGSSHAAVELAKHI